MPEFISKIRGRGIYSRNRGQRLEDLKRFRYKRQGAVLYKTVIRDNDPKFVYKAFERLPYTLQKRFINESDNVKILKVIATQILSDELSCRALDRIQSLMDENKWDNQVADILESRGEKYHCSLTLIQGKETRYRKGPYVEKKKESKEKFAKDLDFMSFNEFTEYMDRQNDYELLAMEIEKLDNPQFLRYAIISKSDPTVRKIAITRYENLPDLARLVKSEPVSEVAMHQVDMIAEKGIKILEDYAVELLKFEIPPEVKVHILLKMQRQKRAKAITELSDLICAQILLADMPDTLRNDIEANIKEKSYLEW
ncbi:MAG: hypothetical protein INQ03_21175 [Candidatus Heimdallarchaeota archaeon]|nr:hypothetical protein [Candidatus Heimdallarchaeota archaeon]